MKKYFITLIALLLSLAASAAVQYNGLWYNLNTNDNTAEVVSSQGSQYSGNISIPTWAYYQNTSYKVTSIGNSAFEGCVDVTSVSIPSSVTSIGNGAFWQCSSLKSVYIPDGVKTIGEGAFHNCFNLVSVFIPSSVTSIGSSAFSNCTNLTQVISLIQVPFSINNNVFTTYSTTTLFTPKGTKSAYLAKSGWKKFTNINDEQKRTIHVATAGTLSDYISDCEKYYLEELTLSGELNGTDIFLIRKMAGIYHYTTGRRFDGATYYDTDGILKSLDISNAKIVQGGDAYMATDDRFDFPGVTMSDIDVVHYYTKDDCISALMFYGTRLESIILPNSAISIERAAFRECSHLTSIEIPRNVKNIDISSSWDNPYRISLFCGCTSLSSIEVSEDNNVYDSRNGCNAIIRTKDNTLISGYRNTRIPNSVTSIGNHAFSYCSGLSSLTLPNSVTSIGAYAFSGCSGLTTITSEIQNPFAIDDYVFSNYATATLVVPDGKKSAYKNTAGWSKFQNIVEVGQGDIIGQEFENNGIRYKIGENNTVSVIQRSQKYSGDVVIPSHVSYNGVNYTVTTIGSMAFGNYCTELTSITIPPTVTCIEEDAFFDYLISLNAVHISDLNAWCSISINGAYSDTCPFNWAKHLYLNGEEIKDLVIPGGVTSINNATFYGCSGLTSITISNSVTSIGSYAFAYCSELTSLTIPNSVTSIGSSAFNGCVDLVRIVSRSKIPPTCESGTFSSKAYCTVWVPKGCRDAYLKANEWKDFKEIKEIDGDINLDGKVNKADIDALVTYIMHGTPAIYGTIADLNNDENVNAADVVTLVNLLNNGGLSTEFQPYFGNNNGNSIVTSIVCTLNNERNEAILLTKCELYCNNSQVSYKSYSGGSSSTVAAGGSKDCSFTGLSMPANSSNFSVVWYYTYNGESYTYRCDMTK